MQILDVEEVITLSIKVTEPINPKQLLTFLQTSILNSNIKYSQNSYFYYVYVELTSSYELIIFQIEETNHIKNIILEPYVYLDKAVYEENSYQVYLSQNYFVLFQGSQLIFIKKFSENSKQSIEDIEIYISQLYKIDSPIIQIITQEDRKQKQEEFLHNPQKNNLYHQKFRFYPLFENKSYQYFVSFIGLCLFCLIVLLYLATDVKKVTSELQISNKKINITKYIHEKPYSKIIPVMNNINKYNLTTKKINFENNKLEVKLFHQDKKNLLSFLTLYTKDNRIEIKSLKFDTQTSLYDMDVIIAF